MTTKMIPPGDQNLWIVFRKETDNNNEPCLVFKGIEGDALKVEEHTDDNWTCIRIDRDYTPATIMLRQLKLNRSSIKQPELKLVI